MAAFKDIDWDALFGDDAGGGGGGNTAHSGVSDLGEEHAASGMQEDKQQSALGGGKRVKRTSERLLLKDPFCKCGSGDSRTQQAPDSGREGHANRAVGRNEIFIHRRKVRRDPFGLLLQTLPCDQDDEDDGRGKRNGDDELHGHPPRVALGTDWTREIHEGEGGESGCVSEDIEQVVVRLLRRTVRDNRRVQTGAPSGQLHEEMGGSFQFSSGSEGGEHCDSSEEDCGY